MNDLLNRIYFHNTIQDYLIALTIIILGTLIIKIFKRYALTRLEKWTESTKTSFDNYIVKSVERFGIPILYVGVIYAGLFYLNLPARLNTLLASATTVAVTILVIRFISSTILLIIRAYLRRKHPGSANVNELGAIQLVVSGVIWFLGLGFLLDNLGYDLTAIIAGLGIGGIAVALAAQNILGDLFNYFVIFLDKPFEVGDYIAVGDKSGTIEHIGVKTTRLKSLTGEQLIIANSDLTSSRIHNFKRMEKRRIVFKIGVTYQTSHEDLQKIPDLLKSIVESQNPVLFDRAHFVSFGDSSLDFEVVYNVLSSEYNKYMDIQQAINLGIFKKFEQLGIEMAYPTRTLFVVNQEQETEEATNLRSFGSRTM
ncbi:mechanosensitive ion channel family protein [Pontibacter arcticus]|uniref:Mechanosensitive ion channel family protein n=1 Tax=Pontibacter arcticus TaxID=2080288 RepID=A0A364RHE5_9BACT|nr:mechanosensitive ion channel family protein [Pontibacter arcticus]RAU83721.1 mechanosensitive ion channel family protein [Pontibacter arcticus]